MDVLVSPSAGTGTMLVISVADKLWRPLLTEMRLLLELQARFDMGQDIIAKRECFWSVGASLQELDVQSQFKTPQRHIDIRYHPGKWASVCA